MIFYQVLVVIAMLGYVADATSEGVVKEDPSVSEIQAFLEHTAAREAARELRELPLGSRLRLLYLGGERKQLAGLAQADKNALHDEGVVYLAKLTDIGSAQDDEICVEVAGKHASEVDFARIETIQRAARANVDTLNQASYARMLARLTSEGRTTVSHFVERAIGKGTKASTRGEFDFEFLETHRKVVVYLAQRKCLESRQRVGEHE